ncbi:Head vertex protein [Escherichia phage EcS1]|uniref:Capsid vertex protein n=1 Tax=Escherichia phage EcS1 TaxID=2083276 RepID=A0A2Z5ZCV1_9CAUD|nr:Head vertex protein [Escherichia phage EcS1]BBC78242.1 Head vertex protein [Escherichia phage EcS1]
MSKIHTLLRESTTTSSSSLGRPDLVALTRATTKLIYSDIVAEQRTSQPVAALYGIKYLNPNDDMTFTSGATYAGPFGTKERKTVVEITDANKATFTTGKYFKYKDIVYKVLGVSVTDGTTETDLDFMIQESMVLLNIRSVHEAAETAKFEASDVEVSEASFEVSKWNAPVKSRKLKTALTVELMQDLEANGFNSPNFVEDLLATEMADEINKDIIQSLITVSSRYKVTGETDKGILDLTTVEDPLAGRKLYRMVCEINSHIQRTTSYSGTYVVASTRVAAVLASSGWLKHKPEDDQYLSPAAYGFLANGLPLYCDASSPLDYVIVGVKEDFGELEMVGSLFYAPYTEGLDLEDPEHVGAFKVIVDPESLQPSVALLVRYALSANPYTVAKNEADARIIDATDMDKMAGQSDMSVLLGVKLPKLIAG